MSESFQIGIPLINPNEPEALLAALHVSEGQQVAEGDLICILETTKSTAEVVAEASGYVAGLQFAEGDTVRAGDMLCYLVESFDEWVAGNGDQGLGTRDQESGIRDQESAPDGLRITQPALTLAQENDLSLVEFPLGPLVTEKMVRARLVSPAAMFAVSESEFDPTAIIIYGGGGHGKSLLDLLRFLGTYRVAGFVDDGLSAGDEIMGLPVLGGSESLPDLYAQGTRLAVNAVGGIGRVDIRVDVFRQLAEAGFVCPAVVHPTALVEPGATLAPGVQVFSHAYVGSEAQVGFGSIVNTGAILSHDCVLGNFVNISPGAILAGEVQVGDGALIGMGVTVNLQAKIGAGARIGNGATVKSDVPENGVVRAGGVWPA